MYSVYANNTCIYNDMYVDEGHRLINPKLKKSDNSAGSFTAILPPTNVGYEIVKHMATKIIVKRDGVEIWEGRVISEQKDFWNQRSITCEGELGYLNDTIQPPNEYHDITVRQFLEAMINVHNAKAGADKQFKIGVVTVNDSDSDEEDSIFRYTNYESTLSCISEKLVSKLKGHLRIRKVNGVRYLDYLKDYPNTNQQVLRFGKNLLDFTKNWDLTDLHTVVVPKGKSLEESPIEALTAYLTVESVNNGSIYVASEEAVKEYGWIEGVVEWSDVEVAENLLKKAKRYLEDYQFNKMVLELNAMDMHYLTKSDTAIELLDEIRCVSKPHGMDRYFPVTEVEIPLNQPEKAIYKLGADESKTLSASTNSANSEILQQMKTLPTKQIILRQAKENATEMIHTATHGYVVMNYDDNGAYEILIMDTNDIKTAKKVWRWNMGGFGYSKNGYAGPYEVAMTMDGSIVANFITTGTMFANRIKGGQLTMGGIDNENGVIYVKNSNGAVCVTIDCNGININNGAFSVDMNGNVNANYINAFGITGNAASQFSQAVDDSEAMRLARQAIANAQSAANTAQAAADKANQNAQNTATHVANLNNTIIPDINGTIRALNGRVAAVEAAIAGMNG